MKKIVATILIIIILTCFWNPSTGMLETSRNDWWDLDWEYKKEITIDHDMIDTDLTNFPILFHNISSDFADHAQNDGDDFAFISSDETTQYNHEIEYYDDITGELIAWVNITSLSSTVDTTFYLYYGNPTSSNQENIADTWNSDYIMVQHLHETSGTHFDSTYYDNDGSPQGNLNQDATGVVDGADEFDGFLDYVNVADDDSLSFGDGSNDSPFTVCAFVYLSGSDTIKQRIVCKADTLTNGEYLLTTNGSGKFAFYMVDQSEGTTFIGRGYSTMPDLNQWYYLVGTYDGSSSSSGIKLYLDGSRVDDSTASQGSYTAMENSDRPLYVGKYALSFLTGIIDEVRVSKTVRNAEWISTCYNTMNNPETFLSVGSEQTQSENIPPTVEITYPEEGQTVSGSITISGISNDPDGIVEYVEVKIDEETWETATGTTSWTYEWDTTQYSDGDHTIYARSYDGEDYSNEDIVNVTIDNGQNQPPTIEISYPKEGQTVNGTIKIIGSSEDPDGIVEYVEVKIDEETWQTATGTTTWTYEWDTTLYSEGTHVIYARSYDGEDYSNEDMVNVTVDNLENLPPTVEITYPEEGQTVDGIITITGTSNDPDGIVEYVEVKIDEETWETATGTTSWTYEWNTYQHSEGAHTIYARSYDGEDYSDEDIVNVTIENGDDTIPPYVKIITPHYGCIYFTIADTPYVYVPSIPFITLIIGKIYVIVNATDNVGVESVKFYVDNHYQDTDNVTPYIWLWNNKAMLFPYELKVVARDYAGNEATDIIKVWRVQVLPLVK